MRGQAKDLLGRFLKFGVVGGSGVLVNMGIYWLLTRGFGGHDSWVGRVLSYTVSVELSILSNFVLNDFWTFRDLRGGRSFQSRFWRFHLVSGVGFLINVGVFSVINWLLCSTGFVLLGNVTVLGREANIDDILAGCIGIGFALLWNFLANLLWTWKGES